MTKTTTQFDPKCSRTDLPRSDHGPAVHDAALKKVLLCHNVYQQPGGEDKSFEQEAQMLESHGHAVLRFSIHNDTIDQMSRLQVAKRTIWNRQVYGQLQALFRGERPDIVHFTNTFPLISPAAYYAARKESVPVVQSLRNYRLLCPGAYLLRNGRVCEDCLGKAIPWPGVLHGCYRESRLASAVVTTMLGAHRSMKTWAKMVDCYFALTEFSRIKFIEGGLPADRIAVKPNFIDPDPLAGSGDGRYAIFVGRLSAEKGIDTLLAAWSKLTEPIPLKIVGDGPLADTVRRAAIDDQRITWLGSQSSDQVIHQIGEAACLVMPSIWYECFPRTILEALAKGTPVIASRLGSMTELIDDGCTGLHFEAGHPDDLASKVQHFFAQFVSSTSMRHATRKEYEQKYTADRNYQMLMQIYDQAIRHSGANTGDNSRSTIPCS